MSGTRSFQKDKQLQDTSVGPHQTLLLMPYDTRVWNQPESPEKA